MKNSLRHITINKKSFCKIAKAFFKKRIYKFISKLSSFKRRLLPKPNSQKNYFLPKDSSPKPFLPQPNIPKTILSQKPSKT
ncbi:hypothetical protein SAMN05661012_05348 [Chitinophaga sancti]|uniref:Uncharacterized protein n=1 Tax=Chitinophaga sancti TaxID=1004 RepID=A0A1K1SFH2_9BACT|nr:hypothetical protein SAMN05661012_05348 [Chitinophaga sancti]